MVETLLLDLRFGFRALLKRLGFTLVAVTALALCIGANTAVFSIVNTIFLRPLPFEDPDRLVFLTERNASRSLTVAFPDFLDWQKQNRVFHQMGAYQNKSHNLTEGREPERLQGAQVTASMFATLGVKPILGRALLADEDKPGAERVVMISEGLWRRRFSADPTVLGKTLTLDGQIYAIIGVMPSAIQFPLRRTELWTSLGRLADQPSLANRGSHPGILAVARLKPGVAIEQARAEMDTIARQFAELYPDTNRNITVRMMPLMEALVGDLKPAVLALFGAVAFVLLIGCANVANLLLARSAARQKEIAVRIVLGASRRRLICQLLTENILLALIGGVGGSLLAVWWVNVLVSVAPANTPRMNDLAIDGWVLAFTLSISVLTGIIFGLAPALQASKPDLNESLKERTDHSFGRGRFRSLLVISEVALALVLLISAGLMIKSFVRMRQVNPGFNSDNVLTLQIALPQAAYGEEWQRRKFFQQLIPRIEMLPGVKTVGAVTPIPLSGDFWGTSFSVIGQPPPDSLPIADLAFISPNYFRAMGVTLLQGRHFIEQDSETAPPVAIIDETFARQYWPGQDPLGKQIKFGRPNSKEPWWTIVGVVRHVRNSGVTADSRVQIYVPYVQTPEPSTVGLVAQSASDNFPLAAMIRDEVRALDKDLPIFNIRTTKERIADAIAEEQVFTSLMAIFAAAAMVMAALGIYGVISYTVSQQTQEIGIRMALGAQRKDILKLVIGRGMVLTLIGVVIGLAAAFAASYALSTLLFGVTRTDPIIFSGVPLLMTGVALLASYVPARKAMKIDPIVALRYD